MAPSAHAPLREGLGTLAHAEGGQPSLQLLQLCQQPLSEHRDQRGCTSLRLSPLGVVTKPGGWSPSHVQSKTSRQHPFLLPAL